MKTSKNDGYIVKDIKENSIAQIIGIKPLDRIIGFNGQPLIDIIDYVYFSAKTKLKIDYVDQTGKHIMHIPLHLNTVTGNT
jgi:S1-C subfamily serine protease